jgi:hypothetical protein
LRSTPPAPDPPSEGEAEAARPRICLSMNYDMFITSPCQLVESWVGRELEMVGR